MPGQHLQAESESTQDDIRHRGVRDRPLLLLFLDDDFDESQDQGQPGRCRDEHGEDHTHDKESAEHIRYAGDQRAKSIQAKYPAVQIHEHTGEAKLKRGKPAVGTGQRQNIKDKTQRIEGGMLARGEERRPAEKVGVPQRYLAFRYGLPDEVLPDVVLKDQVAQQFVVGNAHSEFRSERTPGFDGKQVVDRQKGAGTYGDRPEEEERQEQQCANGYEVRPQLANSQFLRFLCRHRISQTRQAASNFTGTVILDRPIRRSSK